MLHCVEQADFKALLIINGAVQHLVFILDAQTFSVWGLTGLPEHQSWIHTNAFVHAQGQEI